MDFGKWHFSSNLALLDFKKNFLRFWNICSDRKITHMHYIKKDSGDIFLMTYWHPMLTSVVLWVTLEVWKFDINVWPATLFQD